MDMEEDKTLNAGDDEKMKIALLTCDHQSHPMPKRGTKLEDTRTLTSEDRQQLLDQKVQNMMTLQLLPQRQILLKNVSVARWLKDRAEAVVETIRGKHFEVMGYNQRDKLYLRVEEAVYLVDKGRLELLVDDLPVSLQRAYYLLYEAQFPFEYYLAYSYLRRLGYVLFRVEQGAASASLQSQQENNSNASSITSQMPNLYLITRQFTLTQAEQRGTERIKIIYDVYLPPKKSFSKKNRGAPAFKLCILKREDPPPSPVELELLEKQASPSALKFAVVGMGTVDFFSFRSVPGIPH